MKPPRLSFSLIALATFASINVSIFADAEPAVIAHAANRRKAILTDLEQLTSQNLKDGLPTPEAMAKIDSLMSEDKGLETLVKAADHARKMAAIPETERFQVEFNPSKSEERDLNKFSLLEACKTANNGKRVEGILQELRLEAQKELNASGVMTELADVSIPRLAMEFVKQRAARHRAATQSVTGSNLGSQFVQTEVRHDLMALSSLIPGPILEQAGAFVLRGLMNNITIPIIAPTGAITTKAENAAANAVDHATTSKSMTPKRLPAYVDVSDQLVMQVSPDVEALLLKMILERLNFTKDQYGIHGTASSTVPQGIIGTSGIGSVAGGTDGLAPAWSHFVDLETAVANANANGNVYLTNSRVRGKCKKTAKVSSTDSVMLWETNNTINGYAALTSNVVSNTLDKGTSTGVCSAIIFGDFSKLLMGYWGGLLIEKVRDKTGATTGTGTIVCTEFFDSIVQQPAAFAAMLDALTA